MRIETSIMILKIETKNSKGGSYYVSISFAEPNGDTFNIITKDMQYTSLEAFNKYDVILSLTSSKYGLKLSIDHINE